MAIRCEAAIGMRRVKINGTWYDRGSGGIFDTKDDCQRWIDSAKQLRSHVKTLADPMFIPVVEPPEPF